MIAILLSLQTAEEWLQRFETSLGMADSVEFQSETTGLRLIAHPDAGRGTYQAHVYLKPQGRFRLDGEGRNPRGESSTEIRCDGETLAGRSRAAGRPPSDVTRLPAVAPPEGFSTLVRTGLSRAGTVVLTASMVLDDRWMDFPPDPATVFALRELELDGEEVVRGRRTVILRYRVMVGREGVPQRLWLDAQTGLPVQRVFTLGRDELTETYTRFEFERRLNDSIFAIPRDWLEAGR